MVSTFRVLVDEVRRNIPDVLLATMSILFTNYKQLKANSVKASTSSPAMPSASASSSSSAVSGDGGMERHLSRLREQAKAVITFAGMIPYRMPGTLHCCTNTLHFLLILIFYYYQPRSGMVIGYRSLDLSHSQLCLLYYSVSSCFLLKIFTMASQGTTSAAGGL